MRCRVLFLVAGVPSLLLSAHDDEGVGRLVAGVLQPLVVCFEWMSPLPTITAILLGIPLCVSGVDRV